MWKLRGYLGPYRQQAILGACFKFIEVICELMLPSLMAIIVDRGVKQRDQAFVWRYGVLMMAIALLGFGSASVCQYFAARSAQGFGTDLRRALFKKISGLSYQQQDLFGTATLTTRLTNDVNQLQLWTAMMIRQVSRAPFMILGSLVMAFILDWRLALILLVATPILGGVVYWLTTRMSPLYRRYQRQLDHLSAVVKENLSGVRVIRAFTKMTTEGEKFHQANDEITATGQRIGRLSALYNPLTGLVVNLMIVVILWSSGTRVDQGTLAQGTVLALINYVNMILAAILMLSNLVILMTKAMASGERVNEILDTPLTEDATTSATVPLELSEPTTVALAQVDFYFPDRQGQRGAAVLQNLTLALHNGETVGIIGGTGAGKSTFLNLLPRFYQPSQGEIRLFGQDSRTIPLHQLRQLFAIVPQETMLFTGTIRSNLQWGAAQANDAQLWQALKTAQAAEFVQALPAGLDAPVERGGRNFSGGQKQRLTIARALVKQAPLLLLDDATSALDYLTEANFLHELRQQSWKKNTLLVSQRIGTVAHCDRVMVLRNGRLVGFDTHERLLATNQFYQELVASQLDQDKVGAKNASL
ncbi:ABC transporter ATP-binding protein [Lapidilactobacillus luobeiensis]|uniref:ABC transporter ATP-binding protein n=1 Tax=Lapidilactobacillus luobeiensis TaxID=2950371 RepID=UPI0021C35005|nr:ABC transporter ATP-binding protein [Lapidilactobacillus luobeiensis]